MNRKIFQAVSEGERAFHAGAPLHLNPYEGGDGAVIETKLMHLAWSIAWLMEEAAEFDECGNGSVEPSSSGSVPH